MPEDYDPETMDPWVAHTMVDQVAQAIEEGRSYFIQIPKSHKAEFLRAVADRLEEGDPEGAVPYYHFHFPENADRSHHAHPGGDRAHHHDDVGLPVYDVEGQPWEEVISDLHNEKQRGPRYRQEGHAEVYERREPEPDVDPDHLGSTYHSHEHADGKGHSHSHVNGWWPHRHNPDSGRAAYGGMKQVDPNQEQHHERYQREPRGTVEVWEHQPLTERGSRRKHMDCMASTGCLVGSDEDCPMLQTEHLHEISRGKGYTHTHVGGHTDHDHPMNDPKLPQGGHAHIPGMPCSWCPPVSEETQRIYDEAHRKPDDPWPGESYEGTSLRDLEGYMRLGVVKLPDRNYPFGEFDAKVWAEEFLDRFEHRPDLGTLIAWFANAIMTGYDEGRRQAQLDLHELTSERSIWTREAKMGREVELDDDADQRAVENMREFLEEHYGSVDPIEVDDEGNVTHPGPLRPEEPEHWSWVDLIVDILCGQYNLDPGEPVERTVEQVAGDVYRALAPRLAELERRAHPLHEAQAWGEAQQARARAEELEEELERAQKQLDDCWRLRSLAETLARQRIYGERPSAWTHVRRDTMNELRRYLGIDLEAEEREHQEYAEREGWSAEQEADARSTRLGEETDDATE